MTTHTHERTSKLTIIENHTQHRCTTTHWHRQHHHMHWLTSTSRLEHCRQAPRSAEISLEAWKQQDTSDGQTHTQLHRNTQKHTLEKHTVSHWLICPTFPRLLADLGWGSFFSCISLSLSLFLLPLTAHDRVSPHRSPLKHNAHKSLFNPLPPNRKRFNGLIHKLPCLPISVLVFCTPYRTETHIRGFSPSVSFVFQIKCFQHSASHAVAEGICICVWACACVDVTEKMWVIHWMHITYYSNIGSAGLHNKEKKWLSDLHMPFTHKNGFVLGKTVSSKHIHTLSHFHYK